MFEQHALLVGKVEHRRIRPVEHRLAYNVFSILVNLEELGELDKCSRFLSINKPNVLSFRTADLADGEQSDLSAFANSLVSAKHPEIKVSEIWLQTYPRVFGYVFNPLSVYVCLNNKKNIVAAIYEVSNTFGERIHYVQKVTNGRVNSAQKNMLVSPFNQKSGDYGFSLLAHEDDFTIGVSLRQKKRSLLKTWFRAKQRPISNFQVLSLTLKIPFLTLKVIVAIHYEALKLWLKGLRPPRKTGALKGTTYNSLNVQQESKHVAES